MSIVPFVAWSRRPDGSPVERWFLAPKERRPPPRPAARRRRPSDGRRSAAEREDRPRQLVGGFVAHRCRHVLLRRSKVLVEAFHSYT